MTPVDTTDSNFEPEWDYFGISRCDFRPHWDGDLVNLFSTVVPLGSADETGKFMQHCAREIAAWVLESPDEFGQADRFQIIIGWPKTVRESGRQAIKVGGDYEQLKSIAASETLIELRRGWSVGVFES